MPAIFVNIVRIKINVVKVVTCEQFSSSLCTLVINFGETLIYEQKCSLTRTLGSQVFPHLFLHLFPHLFPIQSFQVQERNCVPIGRPF